MIYKTFVNTSINNVLVLAPHTDDGELGAGGFIHKLIEAKKNVYYLAFSTAAESVPKGFPKDILKKELYVATSKLGIPEKNIFVRNYAVRKLNFHRQEILEDLIKFRAEINFDLVLIPSTEDIHQDHQTVAIEGIRAFKNTNILSYELIWNNFSFDNHCFIELSKENLEAKIASLKSYKSQGFRTYLDEEFIRAMARVRGVQSGCEFAESFKIVRLYG